MSDLVGEELYDSAGFLGNFDKQDPRLTITLGNTGNENLMTYRTERLKDCNGPARWPNNFNGLIDYVDYKNDLLITVVVENVAADNSVKALIGRGVAKFSDLVSDVNQPIRIEIGLEYIGSNKKSKKQGRILMTVMLRSDDFKILKPSEVQPLQLMKGNDHCCQIL